MTKHPETYYYFDPDSSTVFYSSTEEDRPDLINLGSSVNPNKRMAITVKLKPMGEVSGYTIKPLV